MSMKSIALGGAALFALTMGAGVAQAHEQDEQVRQLNIQQLEKAQALRGATATAPMPASETTTPDGQGGPELQGPPKPDEGMKDDEPASSTTAPDPATPPDTSTPAEKVPETPAPPPPAQPE